MAYDLVITGGVVVDGTGLARRRADVGVRDGRIVEVGHLSEPLDGAQVVDAEGLIIAPGIIDAHTHYDPQLTFDGYATSSCYHGVTTVLAGNCGFSIAGRSPPTTTSAPSLAPISMYPSTRSRWAPEMTGPTTVSLSHGSPTFKRGAAPVSFSTSWSNTPRCTTARVGAVQI